MAQPATILDVPVGETVKHGSQLVVFTPPGGGATQSLVCEEIDYKKATRALDQMDEVGKANKSAYVSTKGGGSMTVQLKTATTVLTAGYTGVFTLTDGSTTVSFIITECGPKFTNSDTTKLNLNFAEKLN